MKKDIEWLREEVYALYPNSYSAYALNDMLLKAEMVDKIIELIDQLDKPKKPVIPQFVADYIEKWKHDGLSLSEWFTIDYDSDIENWLYTNDYETNCRREYILVDAIRYGYEVEKEKLYIIKFSPSIYGTPTYGSIGIQNGKKIMQMVHSTQKEMIVPNQYTQEEIEEVDSKYMIFAEEVKE